MIGDRVDISLTATHFIYHNLAPPPIRIVHYSLIGLYLISMPCSSFDVFFACVYLLNHLYLIENRQQKVCSSQNISFQTKNSTFWHSKRWLMQYCMVKECAFEGSTPLNNPPIQLHVISLKSNFVFLPHVTIFWKFWLNFLKVPFFKFDKKFIFWYKSRQTFEKRAREQRHPYFRPVLIPPHKFRSRMSFRGLIFLPDQKPQFWHVLNIDRLCIFQIDHKKLPQLIILPSQDASIFAAWVYFYSNYRGLHQTRRYLV